MPKFQNIPQFIRSGSYEVDIPLDYLVESIDRYKKDYGLEMQPDFQRGHVWTNEQSSRYIEFLLRGGNSSRVIYFNHPNWMGNSSSGNLVLVDGLQRVTACLRFMQNELPAFGYLLKDYNDRLPTLLTLRFNVNRLKTKAEVLQWYLDLNDGGVVHTKEELNKVREMLKQEIASRQNTSES